MLIGQVIYVLFGAADVQARYMLEAVSGHMDTLSDQRNQERSSKILCCPSRKLPIPNNLNSQSEGNLKLGNSLASDLSFAPQVKKSNIFLWLVKRSCVSDQRSLSNNRCPGGIAGLCPTKTVSSQPDLDNSSEE